jgi:cysteine desulfurase / selenocysteine lyase
MEVWKMQPSTREFSDLFVGLDTSTPLLDGTSRRYVNLDNAATTPPFRAVVEHVERCSEWYSSVHRGTGYKSVVSTRALDLARERVTRFLGADPNYHVVIFCGYTTDALNRLCHRFPPDDNAVCLTTILEHHSNLLPWRFHGKIDHIRTKVPCGMLDLEDLENKLRHYNGRVRLVAVTGASNVTGLMPPLPLIARLAHQYGARFLVDASQLAAHRAIHMGRGDDPERIDFLALSGHKMHAPFGTGVLVGPRDFFDQGPPAVLGGGAVDIVTLDDVEWTHLPDREEAGTPNLLGIRAVAKAIEVLESIGMERIASHERELTARTILRLKKIPGIRIYGGCDLIDNTDRLAVIPLQSEKYHHALLAAILSYEWGIGVRSGCFCAHPYVEALLGIADEELAKLREQVRNGDHRNLPGFVRVSLGLYNTNEDVEYLATALETIHSEGPRGKYRQEPTTGDFVPDGFSYDMDGAILD